MSGCLDTVREILILFGDRQEFFAKALASVVEDLPMLLDLKTDGLSCCQVF